MLEVFDERAIALSRGTWVAHLTNVERRRSLGTGVPGPTGRHVERVVVGPVAGGIAIAAGVRAP